MRRISPLLALLVFLMIGCGDDSPTNPPEPSPTAPEVLGLVPTTHWWVTEPATDLADFATATLVLTGRNDTANDMVFDADDFPQIWSVPDVYSFSEGLEATIHLKPSGTIAPGEMISYHMTLALSNLPADQTQLAWRFYGSAEGTMGPAKITILSATVVVSP